MPALAEPGLDAPSLNEKTVPVSPVAPKTLPAPPMPAWQAPAESWPVPGAYDATVPELSPDTQAGQMSAPAGEGGTSDSVWSRAGTSAFSVRANATTSTLAAREPRTAKEAAAGPPAAVKVIVADRTVAKKAGIPGVLFTVKRSDGITTPGRVGVGLDYAGFAQALGSDYASRLRLVALPGCALTTPELPQCQTQTPLPDTANTWAAKRVSGTVTAYADQGFSSFAETPSGAYAATTGPGSFASTPLSMAGSWSAGSQSGDFSYSVPMGVPKSAAGLDPKIALTYSSQSTDSRTLATQGQTSWAGEGWDLTMGFIERQFTSCTGMPNPGDLCYASDHVTMNLGGKSTQLIVDNNTGQFKPVNDDGSKVERLNGAANSEGGNGEHWKITTVDGTQYWFGLGGRWGVDNGDVTKSAWMTPVWATQSHHRCYNANYADSHCRRAWRWNLDYVLDAKGNSMTLFYEREQNWYGAYNNTIPYLVDRGGYLSRIEYGTRQGAEGGGAPYRVLFAPAERCFVTVCSGNSAGWPDTPWDLFCYSTGCPNNQSPTFWTSVRLASVTTQYWVPPKDAIPGFYQQADQWRLKHWFPDPGDNTAPSLWLGSIEHTGGYSGNSLDSPVLYFDGQAKPNRVDYNTAEAVPPMNKYRLFRITPSTGSQTIVTYDANDTSGVGCSATLIPQSAVANDRRCFPQYFTLDPKNTTNGSGWGWFHKYVVATVKEVDVTGGGPDEWWTYNYSNEGSSTTALWRHDESHTQLDYNKRSWNKWQGYTTVHTWHGSGSSVEYSTKRYFRGMHGDRTNSSGGTRTVTLTDSWGNVLEDSEWLAGVVREEYTYDNSGPTPQARQHIVHKTYAMNTSWQPSWGGYSGHQVREKETITATHIAAENRWRQTTTGYDYDSYGLVTATRDLGDTGTTADDTCTTTEYARDTTRHLIDYISQTLTTNCAPNPADADYFGGTQLKYDGSNFVGAAPVKGLVTQTNSLHRPGSTKEWWQMATATFDAYGRPKTTTDALNRTTTTTYGPQDGWPTTKVTMKNPAGHEATTTLDPATGNPLTVTDPNGKVTTTLYDPLGRLTKAWTANRPDTAIPDVAYTYHLPSCGFSNGNYTCDSTSWVKTSKLGPNGNTIDSYAILDGRLRARQTQSITQDGKTSITDQAYDAAGRVWLTNAYKADKVPSGTLYGTADVNVPEQHVIAFDSMSRPVSDTLRSKGVQISQTVTTHDGDRVTVTPPSGGTATTTISDARGRMTTLRQYLGSQPSGTYQDSTFTYDRLGRQTSIKDSEGNTWTTGYDMLGRAVTKTDPDTGTSATAYDTAGQVVSTIDARGVKLAYNYDVLGRKTAVHKDSLAGTKLASWTYDTLAKGQLTSSARHEGPDAWVNAVTAFDDSYRPLGTSVTVPASQGTLAGTYTVSSTYKADGSPATTILPAAGGLPAETLTYGYAAAGHALTMTGLDAYLSDTQYFHDGGIYQRTLGTGSKRVKLTGERDEATKRLSRSILSIEQPAGGFAEEYNEKYTYDLGGNVTGIAETKNSTPVGAQCFQYDGLRRMTEAWTTAATACQSAPSQGIVGGVEPYWTSYTFDKAGGRKTETKHSSGGDTVRTYTTPAALTAKPHSLTKVDTKIGAGAASVTDQFTYDAAGNTKTHNDKTFTWNDLGKVASISTGTSSSSFVYDAEGNRIMRADSTGRTLYLGGLELHADSLTTSATATRTYSSGGTIAVRTTTGGLTWMASDHHGTGQAAINPVSMGVTRKRTDPYGAVRGTTPVWPTQRGFVDGVNDPDTGYVHIGARQYSPAMGRFMSVDPVFDGADPQSWHGYAYANNAPVTSSDPSGLVRNRDSDGGGSSSSYTELNSKPDPSYTPPPPTPPKKKSNNYFKGLLTGGKNFVKKSVEGVKGVGKEIGSRYSEAWAITSGVATGDMSWGDAWDRGTSLLGKVVSTPYVMAYGMAEGVLGNFLDGVEAVRTGDWERLGEVSGENTLDIAGMATGPKIPGKLGKLFGKSGCKHSFDPATPVLLATGESKPIAEIKIGDQVVATNPETGESAAEPVTALHVNDDIQLVDLTVTIASTGNDVTIQTTWNHPFWNSTTGKWTDANALRLGDVLHSATGDIVTVRTSYSYISAKSMHDLTVGTTHTYHIQAGSAPVLVHNCGPEESVVKLPETIAPKPLKAGQHDNAWNEFLGPGEWTNKHPRTGEIDPNRLVSADGRRSIRVGPHEMGSKPTKFHYHEESWDWHSPSNTWYYSNRLVRVPMK
ncbi:polymorphic toxin-type HINT domain-containing protein [Longispora albida]|uniref:polymorphic toxin-type HINT domain-containing protein n=1 Tax=Longispora albida TaxID=203523 RepID=UPI0012FBBD27|nr:polymorphic toxin-type HINT domain-containing protein [Longispora albida]